ncbi:unnamed protein product, partial [Notodromas monacha]
SDTDLIANASCHCHAPRLKPEQLFVETLVSIGKRLGTLGSKDAKTQGLNAELCKLNLNLPAKVWLPFRRTPPHYIVRIPPQAAVVLNSKDKAPYLVYVECVDVDNVETSLVPPKMSTASSSSASRLRQVRSEENLALEDSTSGSSSSAVSTPQVVTVPGTVSGSAGGIGPVSMDPAGPRPQINVVIDDEYADCWSQEEDELSRQYSARLTRFTERDSVSQFSMESIASGGGSSGASEPVYIAAGDVRRRLSECTSADKPAFKTRDPEDPSAAVLKEPYEEKVGRVRDGSPYGHIPTWRLVPVIVKCGDDLRQELMAQQVLEVFAEVWAQERVPLRIRPYHIVVLSQDSGLIEPVLNTMSLHQIKKHSGHSSLVHYFYSEFGPQNSEAF